LFFFLFFFFFFFFFFFGARIEKRTRTSEFSACNETDRCSRLHTEEKFLVPQKQKKANRNEEKQRTQTQVTSTTLYAHLNHFFSNWQNSKVCWSSKKKCEKSADALFPAEKKKVSLAFAIADFLKLLERRDVYVSIACWNALWLFFSHSVLFCFAAAKAGGKGKAKKGTGKSTTRSNRAGLQFPVGR
jgi:hypothetical protein